MYNPKSMKAEEFICHEEVEATLKYADEHKDDTELIGKILEKARREKGLDHREASVLLACDDSRVNEELSGWRKKSRRIFTATE